MASGKEDALTEAGVNSYFEDRGRMTARLMEIHALARRHGSAGLEWVHLDKFKVSGPPGNRMVEARFCQVDQGDWNSPQYPDEFETLEIPEGLVDADDALIEAHFDALKVKRREEADAEAERIEARGRKGYLKEYLPLHAEFGGDRSLPDMWAWWKSYIADMDGPGLYAEGKAGYGGDRDPCGEGAPVDFGARPPGAATGEPAAPVGRSDMVRRIRQIHRIAATNKVDVPPWSGFEDFGMSGNVPESWIRTSFRAARTRKGTYGASAPRNFTFPVRLLTSPDAVAATWFARQATDAAAAGARKDAADRKAWRRNRIVRYMQLRRLFGDDLTGRTEPLPPTPHACLEGMADLVARFVEPPDQVGTRTSPWYGAGPKRTIRVEVDFRADGTTLKTFSAPHLPRRPHDTSLCRPLDIPRAEMSGLHRLAVEYGRLHDTASAAGDPRVASLVLTVHADHGYSSAVTASPDRSGD